MTPAKFEVPALLWILCLAFCLVSHYFCIRVCSQLPKTRTFSYFLWRFKLSGVECRWLGKSLLDNKIRSIRKYGGPPGWAHEAIPWKRGWQCIPGTPDKSCFVIDQYFHKCKFCSYSTLWIAIKFRIELCFADNNRRSNLVFLRLNKVLSSLGDREHFSFACFPRRRKRGNWKN